MRFDIIIKVIHALPCGNSLVEVVCSLALRARITVPKLRSVNMNLCNGGPVPVGCRQETTGADSLRSHIEDLIRQ
jgi:hypothetical protein